MAKTNPMENYIFQWKARRILLSRKFFGPTTNVLTPKQTHPQLFFPHNPLRKDNTKQYKGQCRLFLSCFCFLSFFFYKSVNIKEETELNYIPGQKILISNCSTSQRKYEIQFKSVTTAKRWTLWKSFKKCYSEWYFYLFYPFPLFKKVSII